MPVKRAPNLCALSFNRRQLLIFILFSHIKNE